MRLWARLGAVVREPDHIQIPVSIAESAQAALDDLLYGEEEGREWDREVLAQLEEAIHNGFMHDGPGEINAPWRVRLRLLRAKLRATRRRGWS